MRCLTPSCPWWEWWPSTTSRCLHWMCWANRHPLVRWQWGHPGLCCHRDSIALILSGVPSQILKHCGCFNQNSSCTCHMSACISHMHHVEEIAFMILTVSIKNRSVMGHRSNYCAFFRLIWPSGWGNFPVCASGRSPTVNGSPITRRCAKCSGTGLHGNLTDGSPGGGNSL